jgi:hypothetical protein
MPRSRLSPTITPPALALAFATALAVLPAPATADEIFPGPGYWIYPSQPALDDEELDHLCRAGMSILFADLGRISIIADYYLEQLGAEEPRTMVDAVAYCTRDAESAREYCESHVWEADGSRVFNTLDILYDRDEAGNLRSTVLIAEQSQTSVSYPQRCRDAMVRELMFSGMPPE